MKKINKSGIYKIVCKVNNKIYIGSAVNINGRIKRHLNDLKKQKHTSKHLQNAYNLYGEKSFEFLILEQYDTIEHEALILREQFYLDTLMPWKKEIGYNTCPIAYSPEQRVLSEEHKQKIRKSMTGKKCSSETRKKISMANKGKRNSDDAIERMRQKKIGSKQSEENIAKRAKSFSFIKDGQIYIGTNLKRFAEEHNCHRHNLNMVLKGIRKRHHGFELYKPLK